MNSILTVQKGEKISQIRFQAPDTFAHVLEKGGFNVRKPCGGNGICGKCKAEITGSVSMPNEQEKFFRSRLICQAMLFGDAKVHLPDVSCMEQIELSDMSAINAIQPMRGRIGAAIDIGTTTLAVRIYDLTTGKVIGELGSENPQCVFSADVMGRISAALSGNAEALHTKIINKLENMLDIILSKSGRSREKVDAFVITGNTAMLYLLTGQDVLCLSRAPFKADKLFDEEINLLGGYAYIPPCIDAFVGADTTCAVLSGGMCCTEETKVLCDIGTNGEIALWNEGKLYVTSAAAGPAFEGAGISCGCGSIQGAIDRVWAENGDIRFHTIGDKPPVGICGSGLLDAIAAFLELGIIDETGAAEEELLALTPEIKLTKADIRSAQLAKAAIAAGIETLMKAADVKAEQVSKLYIAGGFGGHINVSSAVRIGLIPGEFRANVCFIGNGALTGAEKLLLDQNCRNEIQQIAKDAIPINLGNDPDFNERFVEHLYFDKVITDF